MSSKFVPTILRQIEEIHARKNADYSQEGDPFSNFHRAAILGSWFNDPVDKVFAILFGIKLARLAELKNGKQPKNESIADSHLDFDTYAVIWHARYMEMLEKEMASNSTGAAQGINYQCSECGLSFFGDPLRLELAYPRSTRFFCTHEHMNLWRSKNEGR